MTNERGALDVVTATPRSKVLDPARFGPWAVVTGASSGIGKELARQIAAHGIHVALVARRRPELVSVGRELSAEYGVDHRVVAVDLAKDDALTIVDTATRDLDVGLLVSNAGDAEAGEFLATSRDRLHAIVRVNVLAQLDLAHHFGRRLAARKKGGLLLVGAMGASNGVPFMANSAATKAYVRSLAEGLHLELAPQGVGVTVLLPGPTETPALRRLGVEKPPMKPMRAAHCASEALRALAADRSSIIPGRLNRLMMALVPASIARKQTGKMFEATLQSKPRAEGAR